MRAIMVVAALVLGQEYVNGYFHIKVVQKKSILSINSQRYNSPKVGSEVDNYRLLIAPTALERSEYDVFNSIKLNVHRILQGIKSVVASLSLTAICRRIQTFKSLLASLSLTVLFMLPFRSLAITGNKISGSTYNENSYNTVDKRESPSRYTPRPSSTYRRSVALHSNKGNSFGSAEVVIQDSKLNSFLFFGFLLLFVLKGGQNVQSRDDYLIESSTSSTNAMNSPRKKQPFFLSYLKKIIGLESSSYHQLTLVYLLESTEKMKLLNALNSIDSKEKLINIVEEVCVNILRHKDSLIAGKLKYLHAISGNSRVEDLYHKSALQEQAKFDKKMLIDSASSDGDGSSYAVLQLLLLTNGPVMPSKAGQLINFNNKESLFSYRKQRPLNIDRVVTFIENLPNYLRKIDRRKNGQRNHSYGYACNFLWSPYDAQEVIKRNELVRTWSEVEFF